MSKFLSSKLATVIFTLAFVFFTGFAVYELAFNKEENKQTTDLLEVLEEQAQLTITNGEDRSNYTLEYKQGENLFESLNALKDKDQTFTFDYQEFSGQAFITSINSITPDSSHFWKLVINGVDAGVGVEQYLLKNNDTVEFVMTEIEF